MTEGPPAKRRRVEFAVPDEPLQREGQTFVKPHPLGVRPSGNALTATRNLRAACGSFTALPDELLMQLLESLLAEDLLRLGGTCKALHAYTRSEELWRALFVE